MILGVIEGQIRGGYFPDCILDPSVIDPSGHAGVEPEEGRLHSKFHGGPANFCCNGQACFKASFGVWWMS